MKIHAILILLTAVLWSPGCQDFFQTEIEIEEPPHDPQLVLHCFGSNNDGFNFNVDVGKSQGLFALRESGTYNVIGDTLINEGPEFIRAQVAGATVELYKDDELAYTVDEISDETGVYSTTLPLEARFQDSPGKKYELRVSHPEFPTASAVQFMPREPQIIKATMDPELQTDEFDQQTREIRVTLTDEPGVKNYYEFLVVFTDTFDIQGEFPQLLFPSSLSENMYINGDYTGFVTDDAIFDGQEEFVLTFGVQEYEVRVGYYTLVAYSLTEELYNFSRSLNAVRETQGNPFAEPVSLYSNVENGFGIFGLRSGQFKGISPE